jgi:hypothetical protein
MSDPRDSGSGAVRRWSEVDRVLVQALERPPAGRRAFVAQACAGDAELRAAVERLLAASEEEDPRLEPGAALGGPLWDGLMAELAEDGEAASSTAGQRGRLAPGRLLGRYEVLELLGSGGMGEVYRARDSRLDREVALKVLPRELAADEDVRRRLEREARTVARLTHPNICALHDLERLHEVGGLDVLVMEYLEGTTLAQRLAHV